MILELAHCRHCHKIIWPWQKSTPTARGTVDHQSCNELAELSRTFCRPDPTLSLLPPSVWLEQHRRLDLKRPWGVNEYGYRYCCICHPAGMGERKEEPDLLDHIESHFQQEAL